MYEYIIIYYLLQSDVCFSNCMTAIAVCLRHGRNTGTGYTGTDIQVPGIRIYEYTDIRVYEYTGIRVNGYTGQLVS